MTLLLSLIVPFVGGLGLLRTGRRAPQAGLLVLAAALILLLDAWFRRTGAQAEFDVVWIAPFGVHFHLFLDGLSLALSLLTLALGAAGLVIAQREITHNIAAFSALYLLTLTGILGVFLARDLFLFFVFYEVMLVPAYFLLTQWGDDKHGRASTTFFIFTQTSGLVLLLSILGLALIHAGGGPLTFDAGALAGTADGTAAGVLILVGFFIAFAVKLPVVPFHTWQAPTYASAPASVGILLAGLMSKAGAYGLLRFGVDLLPQSAAALAPAALVLGAISLLYCSVLAFGQQDIKRLIAYSSAGHLAFVVLGAFALNDLGRSGAIATMLAHALSVSGLFIVAGYLEQNAGSRNLNALGGALTRAPHTGALAIALAMATLGLPGLGNFVGEFLALIGTFQSSPRVAVAGAFGAVLGAVYTLVLLQRAIFGPVSPGLKESGEAPRATLWVLAALVVALLWLGVRPQAALDLTQPLSTVQHAEKGAHVDHS
jgi:NADH-quinone oxidoreductase subunit M